nr:SURP and G-patch domain-containing protein 1 [Euglena gracilis]|eukprot:EG_transcript_20923
MAEDTASSSNDAGLERKRRRVSAWDKAPEEVPQLGGLPPPPSLASAGLQLDRARLEVVHKMAFFVARYGNHLEDMTRERRRAEPRLRWLWNKSCPEHLLYKAKVQELRARLKELRQEGNDVWLTPEDTHHVTIEKLLDRASLAKLDAIYLQRERQHASNAGSGSSGVDAATPSAEHPPGTLLGPAGHHLQDFIPGDVMVSFLQKSSAVLSKPPESTAVEPAPCLAERGGLGASAAPHEPQEGDDPFTLYKKRMMLAYKYRPNPLGNPRTPYY